tara:strand:+ start:1693 stop:2112 length:420 start_codon:yes stop_codon:yes gene_type:complete
MEHLQPIISGVKQVYRDYERKSLVETDLFKKKYSFEKRLDESERIINAYPNRVPIIVERYNTILPKIDRKKYLAPSDLSMGNFLYVIRKRLKLEPEKSLFLFVNAKLIPMSQHLGFIYDNNKDDDGFLYITYCEETTFG